MKFLKIAMHIYLFCFFFPIYVPVMICVLIHRSWKQGEPDRARRHEEIHQARLAAFAQRQQRQSLPKPKTLDQQTTELQATYEANARRIKGLKLSEEIKREMLEQLEMKFIDGLMELMEVES
jgi:hypothetical protein